MESPAVPARPRHDVFGRERELAALRAELGAAMQGDGRLVLVPGEPGIGKTTLVAAHALEAEARGALVVWGRCHEMPGAPAYWPWIQILEALDRSSDALPDACVEELQALRESLRAVSSPDVPSLVDGDSRYELLARAASALSRVAEKRGLVIAIDDLHWADLASVRLLRFLASELSNDPILTIATLRTHETASDLVVRELARLARTVAVGPLERSAVAALLAERLPDARVPSRSGQPDPWLDEICERSDGNPFFVLELAQLLQSRPAPPGGRDAGVPLGVETVIERRLDPLADETRRVLQTASVLGREFDLALLAHVLDRDRAALRRDLQPAVDLGLVSASSHHSFAFAHALVRETLYGSLDDHEASHLHARVGCALEELGGEDLPAALAHHFFEAVQETGPEKALRYACEAGRQMLALHAYEEAVRHFDRALSLLSPAGDASLGVRVRVDLGQSLLGAGRRDRAESVLADAIAQAKGSEEPDLFAQAVLTWSGARGDMGVLDRLCNEQLEAALDRLPDVDAPLRARLLARLSSGLHLEPGAERRRRELADRATRMTARFDDPATVSYVQAHCITHLLGPDHVEERLALADEMLEAATGQPRAELNALSVRIDACAELGDRRGLDDALDAFEQKARAWRHPFFRWHAACFRAAIAIVEGRYEDAEREAVAALELGQGVQEHSPMLRFAQQMFMVRGWQNRLDEIAPLVERGVETTRIVPAWGCALADLYDMLDRPADARREFDAAARDGFGTLPRDTTWLTSMVLLASVCGRRGYREHASTLYGLLRPYAGRIAIASPLVVMVGAIDIRLGRLASLLGRWEEAEAHFADARALAGRMRALPWQAEARFYHAEMLLERGRSGDTAQAGAFLDEAESIAAAIGMQLMVAWVAERRASSQLPAAPAAGAVRAARFHPTGDLFEVSFEGRTHRLRSMVGLRYLQCLLASPGCEIPALDLVASAQGREPGPAEGAAGPGLDPRAREEYRARLEDVREELALAERLNDAGRSESLRHELELLTSELARSFGLGGRPRPSGSAGERARVSVTRAIKSAIRRLAEHDDALAEHLQRSIRTGAYCVYAPSDRDRVSWNS